MKAKNYIKTLILLISALVFASAVSAQEAKPAEGLPEYMHPSANQPHDIRANVLPQLGLTEEQIQQISRVNAEKRPLMYAAQKRFREANRALDEVIYADQVNESDFQARLKDLQLAQAEVAKLRFMNELAVRRILSPEQLIHFREIRQKFEKARKDIENRRRFSGDPHVNRHRTGKDINTSPEGQPPVERPRPHQDRPNF